MTEYSAELEIAKQAARQCATRLRLAFREVFLVEEKVSGVELVTSIDLELDAFLQEFLKAQSPYSVLSEEGGLSLGEDPTYTWVVDPIDGTTNFSRGIPVFGVSIALRQGDSIVVGVIAEPMLHTLYWATKSGGAFKEIDTPGLRFGRSNPEESNSESIVTPLRVSSKAPSAPLLVLNNGYPAEAYQRCTVQKSRVSSRCNQRSFGTTAIELAYLAAGGIDAFICSGDQIWDFAAGILLVEEAGGVVSDWKGRRLSLERDDLLCSTGSVHSELVALSHDLVED